MLPKLGWQESASKLIHAAVSGGLASHYVMFSMKFLNT